jgi:hypothetical protein
MSAGKGAEFQARVLAWAESAAPSRLVDAHLGESRLQYLVNAHLGESCLQYLGNTHLGESRLQHLVVADELVLLGHVEVHLRPRMQAHSTISSKAPGLSALLKGPPAQTQPTSFQIGRQGEQVTLRS